MAKPELVDYIKRHLEKGHRHSIIKNILRKAGHDEKVILEAFEEVFKLNPHLRPKKIDRVIVWVTFAVLGVIILLLLWRAGVFGDVSKYMAEQQAKTQAEKQASEKQVKEMNEAAKLAELDKCDSFLNQTQKDICVLKWSAKYNRTDYCGRIPTSLSDWMFYSCAESIWKKDPCGFELLLRGNQSEYSNCLTSKAISAKNVSICNSVVSCVLSYVSQTGEDACGVFNASGSNGGDVCYYTLAMRLKDKNVCSSIKAEGYSRACTMLLQSMEDIKNEISLLPYPDEKTYTLENVTESKWSALEIYFDTLEDPSPLCDFYNDPKLAHTAFLAAYEGYYRYYTYLGGTWNNFQINQFMDSCSFLYNNPSFDYRDICRMTLDNQDCSLLNSSFLQGICREDNCSQIAVTDPEKSFCYYHKLIQVTTLNGDWSLHGEFTKVLNTEGENYNKLCVIPLVFKVKIP